MERESPICPNRKIPITLKIINEASKFGGNSDRPLNRIRGWLNKWRSWILEELRWGPETFTKSPEKHIQFIWERGNRERRGRASVKLDNRVIVGCLGDRSVIVGKFEGSFWETNFDALLDRPQELQVEKFEQSNQLAYPSPSILNLNPSDDNFISLDLLLLLLPILDILGQTSGNWAE